MLYAMKEFEGYAIAASDGPLGSVKDIYFDDQEWIVRYFVVETGSWLNGRRVLLSASRLTAVPSAEWLTVAATREQVRNSPAVETRLPVSRQQEQAISDYFGWPYYWGVAPLAGGGIAPGAVMAAPTVAMAAERRVERGDVRTSTVEADQRTEGDPHLRSVREVRGYGISARDGSLGVINDFLTDEDTWHIHAFTVDTRKWLPGRTVVVSIPTVKALSWNDSEVAVDLTREEIKNAPPYDGKDPLPSGYSDELLRKRAAE